MIALKCKWIYLLIIMKNMLDFSITPKQRIFASKISSGMSQKEASNAVDIAEQTGSKWAKKPEIKAVINQLNQKLIIDTQDEMRRHGLTAVRCLVSVMNDSKNDKARVEAAKYVLEKIGITPVEGAGLWLVGPTTPEGVIKKELRRKSE